MHKESLLVPYRLRFTYGPDAERYGNPADPERAWIYDESAITALPLAELVAIEEQMFPLHLVDVIQGVRDSSILGHHAASWVAVRMASPEIAGAYVEWSPRAALIYFEPILDAAPAPDADPLDSAPSPGSSPAE